MEELDEDVSIEPFFADYRSEISSKSRPDVVPSTKIVATATIAGRRYKQEGIEKNNFPQHSNSEVENSSLYVPQIELPQKRGRYKRVKKTNIFASCIAMLVALSGVVVFVLTAGNGYQSVFAPKIQVDDCNKFITPVVMQNPQPFACPENADPAMILNASIWRTIMLKSCFNNEFDSEGRSVVSLTEVQRACKQLFGTDCILNPTRYEENSFFKFSEEENKFYISAVSNHNDYLPYIIDYKIKGDTLNVTVGYVPPTDPWRQPDNNNAQPRYDKTMVYTLKSAKGTHSYYIESISEAKEK